MEWIAFTIAIVALLAVGGLSTKLTEGSPSLLAAVEKEHKALVATHEYMKALHIEIEQLRTRVEQLEQERDFNVH